MPRVALKSELYGELDVFKYDTMKEALEAVTRLVKSCQKHYKRDGVIREVSITIGGKD